jgi:6-phosphogluconolactonase/glucosamine-6-phosphate isomerase/deaminase
MQFIQASNWEPGITALTERLAQELAADKQVLWLTSGGSNIEASVRIMQGISTELSLNLSVSLVDERYGVPNHTESNWAKLVAAGFEGKQARLLPVLEKGIDFVQTAANYNQMLTKAIAAHDSIIAQLGIGDDGHIAGILPNSPATTETIHLVTGYDAPPLQRLTMTFPALRELTAAYVFAFGAAKRSALRSLASQDLSPTEQPAQILKELPEAYVYSDQLGGLA